MSIIATERLRDPSFGHLVVTIACAQCGRREIGHLRRYRDGSLHLLAVGLPDRSRQMLTARRSRTGWPVDYYTGTPWDQVAEGPVVLRCKKHGERTIARAELAQALRDATPIRPKVRAA